MPITLTIDTRPRKRWNPRTVVDLTDLAAITEYSKSHLSRVFAQKTNPSVPCLTALANALDLSLDDTVQKIQGRKFNVRG